MVFSGVGLNVVGFVETDGCTVSSVSPNPASCTIDNEAELLLKRCSVVDVHAVAITTKHKAGEAASLLTCFVACRVLRCVDDWGEV